jgi:hypothetical protein
VIKVLATVLAATAFLSLPAAAAPEKMTNAALDKVAGGCGCEVPKGNNGWGNGFDGINPGSDAGGSAPSKTANGSVADAGKININPTTSNGR